MDILDSNNTVMVIVFNDDETLIQTYDPNTDWPWGRNQLGDVAVHTFDISKNGSAKSVCRKENTTFNKNLKYMLFLLPNTNSFERIEDILVGSMPLPEDDEGDDKDLTLVFTDTDSIRVFVGGTYVDSYGKANQFTISYRGEEYEIEIDNGYGSSTITRYAVIDYDDEECEDSDGDYDEPVVEVMKSIYE